MSNTEYRGSPIARFVRECRKRLVQEGTVFTLPRKPKIRALYREHVAWLLSSCVVKKQKEAKIKGTTDMSDMFRYLSFALADYANHRGAKICAYWNNYFRTRLWREKGMIKKYLWNSIYGLTTGYLEKPRRLLISVVFLLTIFAGAYGIITRCSSEYTSIAFTNGLNSNPSIQWYHYVYFSSVTMTTLGYGDLAPNHSDEYRGRNLLVLILCSLEAIMGYALLGFAIAMLWRYIQPHPYADMASWLNDYKNRLGFESD